MGAAGLRSFPLDDLIAEDEDVDLSPAALWASPARRQYVPLPSTRTVRGIWGMRDRIASSLADAKEWLRRAAARATRYVVQAVEDHPFVTGMLALGTVVVGTVTMVIVAPQATWSLLRRAAVALASAAGVIVADAVVSELRHICPGCWTGHTPGLACENPPHGER